jgi:RNase P subunit RPR2
MLVQAKQPGIGLYYVSAVCKSCQKIIPLEDDAEPETKTFYCRDPTTVRCPFCGSIERYHPRELKTTLLRELPPTNP